MELNHKEHEGHEASIFGVVCNGIIFLVALGFSLDILTTKDRKNARFLFYKQCMAQKILVRFVILVVYINHKVHEEHEVFICKGHNSCHSKKFKQPF